MPPGFVGRLAMLAPIPANAAGAVAVYLYFSFNRPVQALRAAMARVATGDLTARVPVRRLQVKTRDLGAAILLTAGTQSALGNADGFYLRAVGAVPLRGIEAPVQVFAVEI